MGGGGGEEGVIQNPTSLDFRIPEVGISDIMGKLSLRTHNNNYWFMIMEFGDISDSSYP